MKLIISSSRTFTDYQFLCQTLAPGAPASRRSSPAAPRRGSARLSLGLEASGQASALPRRVGRFGGQQVCAGIADGAGRRYAGGVHVNNSQAPRT